MSRLFEDEFLTPLKVLSVEDLYKYLDDRLNRLDPSELMGNKLNHVRIIEEQLEGKQYNILAYLSELYCRGHKFQTEWWEFDKVHCGYCDIQLERGKEEIYGNDYEYQRGNRSGNRCYCEKCCQHVQEIHPYRPMNIQPSTVLHTQIELLQLYALLPALHVEIKSFLQKHNKIKRIVRVHLKIPILLKEIHRLIDVLLDANRTNIPAFKDYLSPQHYSHFIRADFDPSKWSLAEQEMLYADLQLMKLKTIL